MLKIKRLCCMRLSTAGVVIGWLGGALSLLSVVIDAVALIQIDKFVDFLVHMQNLTNEEEKVSSESIKTFLVVILWVSLTVASLNFVSSVLLIAGTMKERHLMLIPWLVNNGFVLVINLVNFFVILGVTRGHKIDLLIFLSVVLAGQYLLWTTIYSLYHQIHSQREQQWMISSVAGTKYRPSTWV